MYKSSALFQPISTMTDGKNTSYKDIIKQLAAQAPEPYGAIPPREKQKKNKKKKRPTLDHMENWIAVDSKESLPDEQDLVNQIIFIFLNEVLMMDTDHFASRDRFSHQVIFCQRIS